MYSAIQKMVAASAALPEELSQIFVMYFSQGKTEEEVCTALEIDGAEFQARVSRVARSLRGAAS